MKNRLLIPSIIGVAVAAMSFPGCAVLNQTIDDPTAVSTTAVEDVDKDFDLGTTQDKTYTNDFFGLSVTVAGDWKLLSESEISSITSNVQSNISDQAIKDAIDAGETQFIMYANKEDKTENVNVTVQKLPYSTSADAGFDINKYVDSSVEQSKELLPKNGFEELDVQKTTVTFLAEDVPAIRIKAKYKGNDIYETQVYSFKGSYVASITATSSGSDNTLNSLGVFKRI